MLYHVTFLSAHHFTELILGIDLMINYEAEISYPKRSITPIELMVTLLATHKSTPNKT